MTAAGYTEMVVITVIIVMQACGIPGADSSRAYLK
jgi:hypothetical protein